jgi:hypothetical protein
MATVEQRISRLEGAYEHLATKADLSQLENRLIKWMVGLQLGGLVALAAIVSTVATAIKLLD